MPYMLNTSMYIVGSSLMFLGHDLDVTCDYDHLLATCVARASWHGDLYVTAGQSKTTFAI